jgi:TonB family protein
MIHRSTRSKGGVPMVVLLAVPLAMLSLASCGDDPQEAQIEEPSLLTDESPFRYPVALWDEGVEGETLLMVRVTDTGGVDSVYVLEPSGQAAFDSAAVHGARVLRFAPGRRDDRRVSMWARLPVRFYMNDTTPTQGGAGRAARPDAPGAGPAGGPGGAS